MKKLLTVTAGVLAATMVLSTSAYAGGSGGKRHSPAKALSTATSNVYYKAGGPTNGMPKRRGQNSGCGCGGLVVIDHGAEAYKFNKRVYGGYKSGSGGNAWLKAVFSGGELHYQSSIKATSNGPKQNRRRR